ncbi:hypothetical protein [Pimelobacter simplex]|uniref:hypothetical protein n=1 Tax=Nocardioides simplex TaxID=2045 RepID=UPI0021501713|nr:hypothetical protein [Pimelobacter simplex]UUW92397.1 hypothetical protein M0M43_13210 [Pimelobacter simplex]UUW96225.1 hypothetical protein M0M48_01845 [Pimelobacter simplex]
MNSRLIATLVSWLVASLVGLLGVASPAAAASLDAPIATYAHNAPASSAEITGVATERGPPAIAYDYTAPHLAVDAASFGHSVRPQLATTLTYTAYKHTRQLAQGTGGPGTTRTASVGREVDTRVVQGARCAAKSTAEVADIGHAGQRHQFPNTLKGKSQFYDDVDLGGLASRTKGMDGFLQTNGNTRYVLRNPGGVGVDRTTGLPTDVFTVIRRPDGAVVTMFPGTSPKG